MRAEAGRTPGTPRRGLTAARTFCKLLAIVTVALAEVDRIRALLAREGRTWTRPRSAVLQVLVTAPTPLKVEEIHERLGDGAGPRRVNLSSVYRTINLLHRLRLLRRIQLGDGPHRYELAEDFRAHHHHFVCEACGSIEDVRRCPLDGANLGAGVRSHHLELFGVCRRCTVDDEA
jgi:Fe2+ or Zn2+ uptake regulation protein